jgi:pimeloyl-ACP methyl ester carboxylesterase
VSTPPFLDLPDGVRSVRLVTPRGDFAVLTAAPEAAQTRDPVLLVPGFTGSKEDFIAIIGLIASAGHPVTALDQRGQYETAGGDDPSAYEVKALAEDLLSVVATLGGPVHLVGHSFGGLVARAAVIAQPRAVADLVLMSSGPAAIGGVRRERLEDLAPALPVVGLTGIWAALQAGYASEPGYVAPGPGLEAFLEKRFLAGNPAMLMGMGDALRAEPDRVAELRAAGVRTLVLHGANDDAWLPDVQRDMAHRLGAEYAVVPGAAHSPAAENPDETVRALVEFWRAS